MGRAFEYRKERKFKRWDRMAKQFTKIGKEIAMSVKESGPDPETNPRLRAAIQNAKGVSMPKDRVEAAIKRASSKDTKGYEEVVYEGYAPNGVGIVVECATDNPTRTVANIRMYFSRSGGELGKTGSLTFLFNRRGLFQFAKGEYDREELELELIDHGLLEIVEHEDQLIVYTEFEDYGAMQKALEEKSIELQKSEVVRIPTSTVDLEGEDRDTILELIDKFEQDEDVQSVYHTLALTKEEIAERAESTDS